MARTAKRIALRGPTKRLERDSSLPLYHQLATRLEGEIISLGLKIGDRFHTDRSLMGRFQVSLLTVRQAVDQLVKRGILARQHGSGTYVAPGAKELLADHRLESVVFAGWDPLAIIAPEMMYFYDVYEGIRQEVARRGMRVLFDDSAWKTPDDVLKAAAKHRIRGALVLIGLRSRERAGLFRSAGLQCVSVNDEFDGITPVRPDDRGGARAGIQHLASLGHRRFVHLTSGETTTHWREVRKGYEEAILQLGLDPAANPVIAATAKSGTVMAGFEAMDLAMRQGAQPTAVFAGNDLMAIGAIRRLFDAGIPVPKQVSVLGFDGIAACEFCIPPLSSMEVDRRMLGARAVDALLGAPLTGELVPVHLRARGSLAPPPL